MKTMNLAIISIVIGIIIAALTGLVNTTPNLVGATWYGWPLAWMYNLVTYPPATTFNFVNLIVDIIVWAIIAAIVLYLASWATMKKKK